MNRGITKYGCIRKNTFPEKLSRAGCIAAPWTDVTIVTQLDNGSHETKLSLNRKMIGSAEISQTSCDTY
jgi:hypothetical protein